MASPIDFLKDPAGFVKGVIDSVIDGLKQWVLGEITDAKASLEKELRKAKIEIKIEICEEGVEALQAQIIGLKAELANLDK